MFGHHSDVMTRQAVGYLIESLRVVGEVLLIIVKEITDLVSVEHNKAMKKVAELEKEDGFGALSKMDIAIQQADGKINNYVSTYHLTKKQTKRSKKQELEFINTVHPMGLVKLLILKVTVKQKELNLPSLIKGLIMSISVKRSS